MYGECGKTMPKIYIDGVLREATQEEIEWFASTEAKMPAPEPSAEEHVAQLEREVADLKEALEMLLSGVTDDG